MDAEYSVNEQFLCLLMRTCTNLRPISLALPLNKVPASHLNELNRSSVILSQANPKTRVRIEVSCKDSNLIPSTRYILSGV